jgi:phosphohistidine swiveling domain-containing protein
MEFLLVLSLAVIAREMRIPAVMSVKEPLTRLKNGQRVRMDGGRGKVHLL